MKYARVLGEHLVAAVLVIGLLGNAGTALGTGGSDACPADNLGELSTAGSDSGSTAGLTDDWGVPNTAECSLICANFWGNGPDVIYTFTVATAGEWTFQTCNSPDFPDTKLQIRSGGACPGDACVAGDEDSCATPGVCQFPLTSTLSANLSTATVYYLIVDTDPSVSTDLAFTLEWTPPAGVPECGNNVIDPGEECDDGNTVPTDGCDENCLVETGPGDNCSAPILIDLQADLPFVDTNSTCFRGNDYEGITCLHGGEFSPYDSAEDIIYTLSTSEEICIDINLTSGVSYVGVAIDDSCPPDLECIALATSSAGVTDETLSSVVLSPGTYHIMVDNWSTPECIDSFDLSIGTCVTGACCLSGDPDCLDLPSSTCADLGGNYAGDGTNCAGTDCNAIPTLSEWGLAGMALAMAFAGAAVLMRRRATAT